MDPLQRWPNCTDMVKALIADQSQHTENRPLSDRFSALLSASSAQARTGAPHADANSSPLGHLIARLVAGAGGTVPAAEENAPELLADDGLLRHRFSAGVPLGTARLKLESLRQQWYGQLIRDDERDYVFHVSMPAQFWRQWIGRQP